jgi:hypothetical protein
VYNRTKVRHHQLLTIESPSKAEYINRVINHP